MHQTRGHWVGMQGSPLSVLRPRPWLGGASDAAGVTALGAWPWGPCCCPSPFLCVLQHGTCSLGFCFPPTISASPKGEAALDWVALSPLRDGLGSTPWSWAVGEALWGWALQELSQLVLSPGQHPGWVKESGLGTGQVSPPSSDG